MGILAAPDVVFRYGGGISALENPEPKTNGSDNGHDAGQEGEKWGWGYFICVFVTVFI